MNPGSFSALASCTVACNKNIVHRQIDNLKAFFTQKCVHRISREFRSVGTIYVVLCSYSIHDEDIRVGKSGDYLQSSGCPGSWRGGVVS